MTAPNSMPISDLSAPKDISPSLETPEMIERLAREMRARSGGELPHSFCVEQVKRQLAGRAAGNLAANDEASRFKPMEQSSVFHAWALRE